MAAYGSYPTLAAARRAQAAANAAGWQDVTIKKIMEGNFAVRGTPPTSAPPPGGDTGGTGGTTINYNLPELGFDPNSPINFNSILPTLKYDGDFGEALNRSTAQQNANEGWYQDLYKRATQGSIQNFNTSANRLRERLTKESAVAQQGMVNQRLGTGFSGQIQKGMRDITGQRLGAYSQGLSNLEGQFEQSRLQGLAQAANVANMRGQNNQFYNKIVADLFSNAMDAGAQIKSSQYDLTGDLWSWIQGILGAANGGTPTVDPDRQPGRG